MSACVVDSRNNWCCLIMSVTPNFADAPSRYVDVNLWNLHYYGKYNILGHGMGTWLIYSDSYLASLRKFRLLPITIPTPPDISAVFSNFRGRCCVPWVSFLFSFFCVNRIIYCKVSMLPNIAHVPGNWSIFSVSTSLYVVATAGMYREEGKVNQDTTHAEKPPVCSCSFAGLSIFCEHSSVILLTVLAEPTVTNPFVCDTIPA